MVTESQLRQINSTKPFRPFVFVLNDGRRIRISEPFRFIFSAEARKVALPSGPSSFEFARFDALSVEPLRDRSTRGRRKAS